MTEVSITPKKSARTIPNLYDKTKADARERKRNILYLIYNFLVENKFSTVAETLENDANLDNQYQVCENIDLDIILQEYQSYYYTKFQKYPKITRKIETPLSSSKKKNDVRLKSAKSKEKDSNINQFECEQFLFDIVSLSNGKSTEETPVDKLLSCCEDYSNDWKEMAEQILKEFVPKESQGTNWKDCIGLTDTVEKLKEATFYPLIYPDLFKNVTTWKGILLFGPPGTGKTMLAKALAGNVSTFINVTVSSFVSKWRGESEKLIKVLFELAKKFAPTVIFVDEIDALGSSMDSGQHEASRRLKSELLVQLDGILSTESKIFLLGSTNRPWSLDPALIRRFEKKILVPLPNECGRCDLIKHYLQHPTDITNNDFQLLARRTENLSGSDIKTLCKEATMICVREKISEINSKGSHKTQMELRRVTLKDMERALETVKSCSRETEYEKYFEWNQNFGS
nr:katanin p60 ATPase-containing subunit A-like 2 [Leptinotarsa decemlineata]